MTEPDVWENLPPTKNKIEIWTVFIIFPNQL